MTYTGSFSGLPSSLLSFWRTHLSLTESERGEPHLGEITTSLKTQSSHKRRRRTKNSRISARLLSKKVHILHNKSQKCFQLPCPWQQSWDIKKGNGGWGKVRTGPVVQRGTAAGKAAFSPPGFGLVRSYMLLLVSRVSWLISASNCTRPQGAAGYSMRRSSKWFRANKTFALGVFKLGNIADTIAFSYYYCTYALSTKKKKMETKTECKSRRIAAVLHQSVFEPRRVCRICARLQTVKKSRENSVGLCVSRICSYYGGLSHKRQEIIHIERKRSHICVF